MKPIKEIRQLPDGAGAVHRMQGISLTPKRFGTVFAVTMTASWIDIILEAGRVGSSGNGLIQNLSNFPPDPADSGILFSDFTFPLLPAAPARLLPDDQAGERKLLSIFTAAGLLRLRAGNAGEFSGLPGGGVYGTAGD